MQLSDVVFFSRRFFKAWRGAQGEKELFNFGSDRPADPRGKGVRSPHGNKWCNAVAIIDDVK